MAGLVPVISMREALPMESGWPRHRRAKARRPKDGYARPESAVVPLAYSSASASASATALPLLGRLRNLLFFGKPFGAMRPASARLPRQSLSSFIGSVKLRPAVSVQDRPASAVNVVTSERPFSL